MARPGMEQPLGWDARWTAEDICESYDELLDVEPLVEGPAGDVAALGGDELELVAARAARAGEGSARDREGAAEPAPDAGAVDAETYAVLPEIELLLGMLNAARAEAPPDETTEEAAPETAELAA